MRTVPTVRESETIQLIQSRVDPQNLRLERTWQEEQWLKTMAFFSGKHHFFIEGGRIWDAASPESVDHEVLYKANHLSAAIIRAVAKVLAARTEFRAKPESGRAHHRQKAEISDKVFKHLLEVMDYDHHRLMATMWAAICGTAFLKVVWDPQAGDVDRFYLDADKKPMPDLMLSPEQMNQLDQSGQFEDAFRGEVTCSVASPFAIHHDWTSRDQNVAGCHWMAERSYVDTFKIAEVFDVDERDLQPDDGYQGLIHYEEAIAFMSSGTNISPFSYGVPKDKQGKRASLVQMYERPSRKHKKGRWIVYGGGRVLRDTDNPYAGDRKGWAHLPYVKYDWIPHPGRWWGRSLAEDLTSPQFQLNESRSKMLEFMNVFGCPPTFVDKSAGLDTDNMTVKPGAIYSVRNAAINIKVGATPQMPVEVAQIGNMVYSDLMGIASASDIDGTKMPAQMRSGSAIRLMAEQQSIALNITTLNSSRVTRDVGRIGLTLYKMFVNEKRTMRLLGDDKKYIVEDFSSADLTNDLDIVSEPMSMETRESRLQDMLDAIQAGALNPVEDPHDKRLVLKALKYETDDELFTDKLAAEGVQDREIRDMIRDAPRFEQSPYPVFPWEDHESHMRVLRRFMNTEEFNGLTNDQKSVIAMHWQLHQQEIKQAQAEQMAMLEAAKGAPGQKGRASQPRGH